MKLHSQLFLSSHCKRRGVIVELRQRRQNGEDITADAYLLMNAYEGEIRSLKTLQNPTEVQQKRLVKLEKCYGIATKQLDTSCKNM
ncbi:MAG: hypothetical protein LBG88_00115 [Christensenellaceae bacterium]|jgi:hypothetical protein|nr:hypothetical protein [Christensenellaceae bacterium]